MKNSEIYEIIKSGLRPILECKESIEDLECDPDSGMRGILLDVEEFRGSLEFIIDWSSFEEFNRPLQKSKYYSSENVPCETWFEQRWYEKGKSHYSIFVERDGDNFELVNSLLFYQEYQESKSKLTYVSWLEKELKTLKEKVSKNG